MEWLAEVLNSLSEPLEAGSRQRVVPVGMIVLHAWAVYRRKHEDVSMSVIQRGLLELIAFKVLGPTQPSTQKGAGMVRPLDMSDIA
jgi:hypothetical protein